MRGVLIVVTAVMLIVAACSDTETKSSDGGNGSVNSAPLTPGSSIKVGSATITLNEVVDPFTSRNQFIQPKPGERFVAVDVTITNDGEKPYEYNTLFDWKAQLTDATVYSADTAVIGALSPFLGTGKLETKGDQSRGWVGFAVKADQPLREVRFKALTSTNQGTFKAQ